jgi:UDP-N-acetylglucosamine--N-acetylmuramyl-(pentapeptide) pyrophosphoryl-undecaprenol N-acetylglucosamine transferase
MAFFRGFGQSYCAASRLFKGQPPRAALAMGGFTSAPPILAAKRLGARTFLHESNTIPGRANRWLSWVVNRAFIGFPSAGARLHTRAVTVTGTPVRPQFQACQPAACRAALGLDPARPVVLVMGGSQGATGINQLVVQSLPLLAKAAPEWQWFHLTGPGDAQRVTQAYAALGLRAVVHPFFAEMDLALGAASAAVSRAGASSLAEIAAMRLPTVLVPYPAAVDDHQFHNARAFEASGAARLIQQRGATPQMLAELLLDLVRNTPARDKMRAALAQWHAPRAAEVIAEAMLQAIGAQATEGAAAELAVNDRAVKETARPGRQRGGTDNSAASLFSDGTRGRGVRAPILRA